MSTQLCIHHGAYLGTGRCPHCEQEEASLGEELKVRVGAWCAHGFFFVSDGGCPSCARELEQAEAYKENVRKLVEPSRVIPPSALGTQVGGNHYKNMAIQPVEYIHRNGIGFVEGAVIKYVSRWKEKNGLEDLRKARHMLDLLIELEDK